MCAHRFSSDQVVPRTLETLLCILAAVPRRRTDRGTHRPYRGCVHGNVAAALYGPRSRGRNGGESQRDHQTGWVRCHGSRTTRVATQVHPNGEQVDCQGSTLHGDPRIHNRTGLGLRLQKTGTIQDTRRTPAPFAPFRELEAPSRLLQVLRRADGISLVHRTRKLARGGSRETTLEPPLLCRASANALGWLPESGLSKRQAFHGSIRLGVATAEKAMCQTRKAASRLRGSSG